MVNITVDHIPFSTPHNRRPTISLAPNSITIHSTGNATSTALNERSWLENPSNERTASWHYCVDDTDIIEAIPPNYVAWHAGDGDGQGNMGSISIEMCESGDREKVLARTKELTRHLMDKHNIRRVVRHYDWTKKNCPRILNEDGKWSAWFPFLNDIFNPPKKEVVRMYKPTSPTIIQSTENVLKKIGTNQKWIDQLKKGELTESDAIGLLFVALDREVLK